MDDAFLADRIAATKAAIVAHEAAELAILSGGQSYSLDTGQTRQTVTKSSLGQVRDGLNALLSRLAYYESQLSRDAAIVMRPGF